MKSPVTSRRPAVLFWIVIGVPIAALVAAFPIVCSPLFLKYADKHFLTAQQGAYSDRNRSCDVLIFGDSTTIAGLDPRIINEDTQLSACNIGVPNVTLLSLGTRTLDGYLARNRRPKYLILQFNALNFRKIPTGNPADANIEGLLPLLRNEGVGAVAAYMVKSPDTLIGLMHYTYYWGVLNIRDKLRHKRQADVFTKETGAYMILPVPPLQACPSYDPLPVNSKSLQWIQQLRERYSSAADHLIINAAPTSFCNAFHDQWRSALAGSLDSQLAIYPLADFADGYFHLSREGAIRNSDETAREIVRVSRDAVSRP